MKRRPLFLFMLLTIAQCKPTQTSKSLITLENTQWKLSEMNGNPIITPAGAKAVYFSLTTENGGKKIKGFAGCNSLMGSYSVSEGHIKFNVGSTKMMCAGEQMEIENFLVNTLVTADAYEIEGDVLELYEGNTLLADFKATKP